MRPLLAALKAPGIRALAHITGGGLPENLPRVLPDDLAAVIDLGTVAVPPVFGWLCRVGDVPRDDLLRTFNCGIGMVAVVARNEVAAVERVLTAEGIAPVRLGTVGPRQGPAVTCHGALAL